MYRTLAYTAQKKLVTRLQGIIEPTKHFVTDLFINNDNIREILVMRANTEEDRKRGNLCPEECVMHVLNVFGHLIFLQ